MPNNYIRNRAGQFFCFDDRDPVMVEEANARVKEFRRPKDPAIAWKPAKDLHPDGYVGIPAKIWDEFGE